MSIADSYCVIIRYEQVVAEEKSKADSENATAMQWHLASGRQELVS